jgi:hypothetical protein
LPRKRHFLDGKQEETMTRFFTIGAPAVAFAALTACIPIPIKGNVSFVATE